MNQTNKSVCEKNNNLIIFESLEKNLMFLFPFPKQYNEVHPFLPQMKER